jgi:hypothetical protein
MNETHQDDPNTAGPAGADPDGSCEHVPVSTFQVVPYSESTDNQELYSFREALRPPVEPVTAKKVEKPPPAAKMLLAVGLAALLVVIAFAFYSLQGRKPNVSYIDLGSQRFDPAGLSGRLIARWDSSGSYQLYLDPVGPGHAAGFAAVAADPPRQLSVTIRLLNADGLVACQKQILFPAPVPHEPGDGDSAAPQTPRQSETGDTAENMTGESGQIAEIDLRGPLPCPAYAYGTFKAWDFTADFPTSAEEDEWLRQEKLANTKSQGKGRPAVRTARLDGPIEGDDVIVADNPSHGTVETSGGHVFFLSAGLRNRTAEWQVFPAAIHFRCDKKGVCTLTRANSSLALQARLLK